MPCDSITTQSVALKNAVPSILRKSLAACGWELIESTSADMVAARGNVRLEWTQGVGFTMTGYNESAIARITREYSNQAVSWAASRAGWQVSDRSANQLTVTRR